MNASRINFEGCPLCGSRDHAAYVTASCAHHPLYTPLISPTMQWQRCNQCDHIFTDGYFTAAVAAVVFSKTNVAQMVGADMENQRAVSARMIEKVLPFVSSGSWLDIGFGNGSLLFTAQEFGFKPVGVDLRDANVVALRARGIDAECVNLLDMRRLHEFSVISMADVLEHVSFPTPFLQHARDLLEPEGVLFISMPNADSPLWQAWNDGGVNPYWGELEHYHNFGRERLYALLEQTGFRPVKYGISERYRACMEVVAMKI